MESKKAVDVQARTMLSLWPGLPQLWIQGAWSGLTSAIAFSVILNGMLIATFVRPDPFSSWMIGLAWLGLMACWAGLATRQIRYGLTPLPDTTLPAPLADELLQEAQRAYLARNWSEAKAFADGLLEANPEDVEARLLLGSILKRTGQTRDASEQLRKIRRMFGSQRWQVEIDRELSAIEQLENHQSGEQTSKAEGCNRESGPQKDREALNEARMQPSMEQDPSRGSSQRAA